MISKQPYPIFDIHTHAFPDKLAKRATESTAQNAKIPFYHDGTFQGLCRYEQEGGASGFLLLPIATNPTSVPAVNTWAASIMGDNVYAFGSIHPDFVAYEEELDRIVALGLKGIKLHPEFQEFFVDEERMFPLYKAIFARNLIVCFHAGIDIGFPLPARGDVKRLAKVCDAFPAGRMIMAHMGGFWQYDLVCEHLVGRQNVWMDTSFAAERMKPEEIKHLVALHGAKRFLFGSDAPWAQFDVAKNAVLNAGLDEAILADIFYHNAAALLQI